MHPLVLVSAFLLAPPSFAGGVSNMRPSENVEDRRQELPLAAQKMEELRQEQLKYAKVVAQKSGYFACPETKSIQAPLLKVYKQLDKATPVPTLVAQGSQGADLKAYANDKVDACNGSQVQQVGLMSAAYKKAVVRFKTFLSSYEKLRNALMKAALESEKAAKKAKTQACVDQQKKFQERTEAYVEAHDEVAGILHASADKVAAAKGWLVAKQGKGCGSASAAAGSTGTASGTTTATSKKQKLPPGAKQTYSEDDDILQTFDGQLGPNDEAASFGSALSK